MGVRRLQGAGASVVLVEVQGETIGAVANRDELRFEAPAVVEALRRRNIHVAMLTGDNRTTAEAIGRTAGVEDINAEMLLHDKVAAVERLAQRGPVAMVGDGINASALATASVGIAMGAAGTDVAVEAADVVIMGDSLSHLPDMIDHGRRTNAIMIQNLVFSGLIIAALIPTASFGLLGLGAVVASHELAEIIVILNGLHTRRIATPSNRAYRQPHLGTTQVVIHA